MSRVGALANTVSQHTFQTTVGVLKQGHALAMWIPGVAPLVSVCPPLSPSVSHPTPPHPENALSSSLGWDFRSKDGRPKRGRGLVLQSAGEGEAGPRADGRPALQGRPCPTTCFCLSHSPTGPRPFFP